MKKVVVRHRPPSERDRERVRRTAVNLATLLANILREMERLAVRSKRLRTRIQADLRIVGRTKSVEDAEKVLDLVVDELKLRFRDKVVIASLGKALASKARSKKTVKVDGQKNCVGAQGFGVTVTVNGTSAGACLTGTPGNITGGGVSGGFSY